MLHFCFYLKYLTIKSNTVIKVNIRMYFDSIMDVYFFLLNKGFQVIDYSSENALYLE